MTLTVVEWADRVGRGFAPFRPADSAVDTEYWLAAQALLEADIVAQPPVKATAPHPVWSLRYVEVKRFGAHWCFAVQGRGGEFGVAGTCRFTFTPADVHPFTVWETSVAAEPGGSVDASPPQDVVLRVLESVLLNAPRVRVPGAPAEVAQVISRVLRALPRGMAARRDWSTCLLQRPDVQRPVVTGDLPAEYRTAVPGVARSLDQVRWSPAPTAEALRTTVGRHHRALEWLFERTVTDDLDDLMLHSDATDATALLGEITRTRLDLTVEDVPRLLRTGDVDRLGRALNLVAEWARTRPADALTALPRIRGADLRLAAIEGLVQAHATTSWHLRPDAQAAGLLREWAPDQDMLARHLTDMRRASPGFARALDGGPGRAWLVGLGMSPWHDPELFPDRAAVIAENIGGDPRAWQYVERELGTTTDPGLALDVVRHLPAVRPEIAARLMNATSAVWPPADGYRHRARLLAGQLVARAPRGAREAEQWLTVLLEVLFAGTRNGTGDADTMATVREVMYGGLLALPDRKLWRHRLEPALVRVCEHIGVPGDAPERVRRLLSDVAEQPAVPSGAPSGGRLYVSDRSPTSYRASPSTHRPAPEHPAPSTGDAVRAFLRQNRANLFFLGVVVVGLVLIAVLIPKVLARPTAGPDAEKPPLSATAGPATGASTGGPSPASPSPAVRVLLLPPGGEPGLRKLAADIRGAVDAEANSDGRRVKRLDITLYFLDRKGDPDRGDARTAAQRTADDIERLVRESPPAVPYEVDARAESTPSNQRDNTVEFVATPAG